MTTGGQKDLSVPVHGAPFTGDDGPLNMPLQPLLGTTPAALRRNPTARARQAGAA